MVIEASQDYRFRLFKMFRNRVHTSTWAEVDWFTKATPEQKDGMKDFLLNLDKAKRVHPESMRHKTILNEINEIMESISRKICEIDARFAGRLVPMGSAHNHMKMGDSDEFDFVYEVSIKCLSTFRHDLYSIKDRIELEVDDHRFDVPLTGDTFTIGDCMRRILDKAMPTIELPQGWSHGGFNRPEYSGSREGNTALMLQFDYQGPSDQTPLRISVDFVPMLTLQLSVLKGKSKDIVNEFLLHEGYFTQFWASCMHPTKILYSLGEEKWLGEYPSDSIAKKTIRCCKALLSLVIQSAPKCPARSTILEIVEYLNQKTQGNGNGELPDIPAADMQSESSHEQLPLSVIADFVNYSDLGEAGGHFESLKSYMIKRTVMTLMALEDTKGHTWTDDDLVDLVMTVFMIINDFLTPAVSSYATVGRQDENECGTEKLAVSLAEFYTTNDQPTKAYTMTEDSKHRYEGSLESTNAGPPRFYSVLSTALNECRCMCLVRLGRSIKEERKFVRSGRKYAGSLQVCQLLQSVCEGKATAEIDVLTPPEDKTEVDHIEAYKQYVTKHDFEKAKESGWDKTMIKQVTYEDEKLPKRLKMTVIS